MEKSSIYSSMSVKMEEMKDNNLVHVIPNWVIHYTDFINSLHLIWQLSPHLYLWTNSE